MKNIGFLFKALRLIGIILVILKITTIINWSWWFVLYPLILNFLIKNLTIITYFYLRNKGWTDEEIKSKFGV